MKKSIFLPLSFFLLCACSDNENAKLIKEVDENFTKELLSKTPTQVLSEKEKIEKIISFYEARLKNSFENVKISFIEKQKIKGLEAFIFEFHIKQGDREEKSKEAVFISDDVFFADGASFKDLSSLRDEASKVLEKDKFKALQEALKEDKDFIITLGKGKKEFFVFSDPECPYCKKHLQKINEAFLKEYTLHFIFYSIHDNHKITALLYKALKDKESDEDKLRIMRQYFFENIKLDGISEKEEEKMRELFEKYKNLGVLYTPFEIEKD